MTTHRDNRSSTLKQEHGGQQQEQYAQAQSISPTDHCPKRHSQLTRHSQETGKHTSCRLQPDKRMKIYCVPRHQERHPSKERSGVQSDTKNTSASVGMPRCKLQNVSPTAFHMLRQLPHRPSKQAWYSTLSHTVHSHAST